MNYSIKVASKIPRESRSVITDLITQQDWEKSCEVFGYDSKSVNQSK